MISSRARLGLSRKIVAYYLCFCLVAVCWLAAGVVVTSHALIADRAASSCLSRLGKTSAAIEIQWLRNGPLGFDAVLDRLEDQCQAVHCAVVGADGKIVAHTDWNLVGATAVEPIGRRSSRGDVASVSFTDEAGRDIQEYRTPLVAGGKAIGDLRVAVEAPSLWTTLQSTAPMAPLAVLAPVALACAGALVLVRLTKPVAQVERCLQEIAIQPLGIALEMAPLRARDAVSLGWNRLVDQFEMLNRQASHGSLASVLERAVRSESDARYEEILQRLTDGVAVTDAEGRIAFANHAISALLGVNNDEESLLGEILEQRLIEAASNPDATEVLGVGAKCRTAVCELVQKDDGMDRVLRVSRMPMAGQRSTSHVWSLRDVTQQKLTEQTRDRFIDTATHELRTPLANIKAYAETLATSDCIDIELQKEFCNTINSEVTRLARFIDDLLSISSMEVGALTVDRQKVETARMFDEVLGKVEPLMVKKSIEFSTSLPPKMPEISMDKDKMIAVLVNILGNAAKYTPEGGRVSLKVIVADGRLHAAVKDSGFGISADDLPKLFEKFFRSDNPLVQAETGTGLGLSLAQEVVRMHGGDIAVESELTQGSTFTISIPLS